MNTYSQIVCNLKPQFTSGLNKSFLLVAFRWGNEVGYRSLQRTELWLRVVFLGPCHSYSLEVALMFICLELQRQTVVLEAVHGVTACVWASVGGNWCSVSGAERLLCDRPLPCSLLLVPSLPGMLLSLSGFLFRALCRHHLPSKALCNHPAWSGFPLNSISRFFLLIQSIWCQSPPFSVFFFYCCI